MRVVGLDLSLTGTGVSDGHHTWLVTSRGQKNDDLRSRSERLDTLRRSIVAHCLTADLVVVEQPAFSRTTGHMHDRSGLWWLVVAALHHHDLPVAEVPPTSLKRYATGRGNADKGAVIDATARRLPDVDTGGNDNRADALWLAAMGRDHLGVPLVTVPAHHRLALDAVRWPDTVADVA